MILDRHRVSTGLDTITGDHNYSTRMPLFYNSAKHVHETRLLRCVQFAESRNHWVPTIIMFRTKCVIIATVKHTRNILHDCKINNQFLQHIALGKCMCN